MIIAVTSIQNYIYHITLMLPCFLLNCPLEDLSKIFDFPTEKC